MTAALNTEMHKLLSLAKTQHSIAEADAEARGEHFNIFKILRVGHREVTTHSPMLAALLNPTGPHGDRIDGTFTHDVKTLISRFLAILREACCTTTATSTIKTS